MTETNKEMMFDSLFLTSLISTCKILIARERPVRAGLSLQLLLSRYFILLLVIEAAEIHPAFSNTLYT